MAPPILPNMNNAQYASLPPPILNYLRDLDKWVKQMDGQAVRWGAVPPGGSYIQSPTILAGIIRNQPTVSKAGMSEDFLNQIGQVTDSNGTIRVQWGNLPANGVSPAQEGFRANDASGTPIFDSLGLISVMQSLGAARNSVANQQIAGVTSGAAITSCSLTFSLPRPLHVLTFSIVTASLLAGFTAGYSYPNLALDGTDGGIGAQNHHVGIVDDTTSRTMGWIRLDSLPAGSHTVAPTMDVDAATTVQIFRADVLAFQLGS